MPASRTRDRTKEGFQELVLHELPGLYSLARRLVRDGAEDLVQEALQGYRAYGGLKDEAAGGRWLKAILVNVFRDQLRKRSRSVEARRRRSGGLLLYRTLIDEDPLPYSDSLHADFLGAFGREDLREVLLRMPEIYGRLSCFGTWTGSRRRRSLGCSMRRSARSWPVSTGAEPLRANDVDLRRGDAPDHDGRRRWVRRRPRSRAPRQCASCGTTSTMRSRLTTRRGGAPSVVLPPMLRRARVRQGDPPFLASGSSEEVPAHVKDRLARFVEEL